jgi:hypothetical protein
MTFGRENWPPGTHDTRPGRSYRRRVLPNCGNWFFRFGAVCGILSGLFIGLPGAIEAFTGETAATSFVLGLSGRVAYAVNLVGLGLFRRKC